MPGRVRAARVVVSLLAVGILTSAPQGTRAQRSPRLSFAVATVKVNKSGSGLVRVSTLPGRFSAVNVTLRMLIRNAYGLADFRMSGGPAWMDADRFDVEARSDGAEPADQVRAMLRTLLEDRFKLNVHTETRDLPVYALVVARSDGRLGQQLRRSGAECLPITPPAGAPPAPPPPPGVGAGTSCPSMLAQGNLSGRQLTIEWLAETLSPWVNRRVFDRTGLDGAFDLDLQWMPDWPVAFGSFGDAGGGAPLPPADMPSLFTALQEQLGLRLESQRGPVDMLLIDRVEKPAED